MTNDQDKEPVDVRRVEHKYGFEQKEGAFQKVFWVVIAVFLAAGLLGLFGEGALSDTREEDDTFYIDYQKYLRDETPADFSIFIKESAGNSMVVAISKDYVENVQIQSIVPQPESVETKDNRLVYTFNTANNGCFSFSVAVISVAGYCIPKEKNVKCTIL